MALSQNMQHVDAPLSDRGVQQCEEQREQVKSLPNITRVYVSPLRRALETAWRLFRESPRFKDIQFVVLPLLRETLHTCCDIPVCF